jgi:hypothetical protein
MLYKADHYRNLLMGLLAADLLVANTWCLRVIVHPSNQHTKKSYVENILSHFMEARIHLLKMNEEEFHYWSVTQTSCKYLNRYKSFANFFSDIYGFTVCSILREAPIQRQNSLNIDLFHKYSEEIGWIQDTLNVLVERVKKCLGADIVLTEIKKLPIHRRPLVSLNSGKKTANSLIHHIQCRVAYLSSLDSADLFISTL